MIDARTAVLLGSLNATMVAVSMFAGKAAANPGPLRGSVRTWALAAALQPVGWLFSALRPHIPEVLAVVVGNGVMAITLAMFGDALRRMLETPRRRWLRFGLPAAATLALALLTWPTSYFHARVVLVSLLGSLQLGDITYLLWRRRTPTSSRSRSQWLLGGCFALGSALLLARFFLESTHLEVVTELFSATPMESLVFLYIAMFSTLSSLMFLTFCNDRYQDALATLATTDALTGLANRRGLDIYAERLLARRRRVGGDLSVIVIDIDHFKDVNDRYGHEVGDLVLSTVARRLTGAIRAQDLLSRVGGEEFVLLVSDASEADAMVAAERLRRAASNRQEGELVEVPPITISSGVAVATTTEETLTTLLRRADRALYAAKQRGRDRSVAASLLDEDSSSRETTDA